MKFEIDQYHRNTPDENLIEDVKKRCQENRKKDGYDS